MTNQYNNVVAYPVGKEEEIRFRKQTPGVDQRMRKEMNAHLLTVEHLVGWGLDTRTAHALVVEIKNGTIAHLRYEA